MKIDKDISASDIMSKELIVLHPKDRLSRAKEIFDQYKIHHIPIAVMGKIKGIISLGDLLFLEGMVTNTFDQFIQTKKYELTTVDEIMTARPFSLPASSKVSEVLDLMLEKRVNCILLEKNDELDGMLTSYDIMKYFRTLL